MICSTGDEMSFVICVMLYLVGVFVVENFMSNLFISVAYFHIIILYFMFYAMVNHVWHYNSGFLFEMFY